MGNTFRLLWRVAMPWTESSIIDERWRFVARLLEGEQMTVGNSGSRGRPATRSSIATKRPTPRECRICAMKGTPRCAAAKEISDWGGSLYLTFNVNDESPAAEVAMPEIGDVRGILGLTFFPCLALTEFSGSAVFDVIVEQQYAAIAQPLVTEQLVQHLARGTVHVAIDVYACELYVRRYLS